jgi:hypothetical protein
MNIASKAIKRPRCEQCGEVYETVGNTAIRLAQPRPPTRSYNQDTGDMKEDKGVCPKHPRSLGYEL